MNTLLPNVYALLQSNDQIARAVESGRSLAVDLQGYGGFTGVFAQIFLVLIGMWAGMLGNYGLAIILTAITVRLLLVPLTIKQIQGMKMMTALQPVQKEVTRYYPNKADQNAKMMELYQEYKINPLSGCLPMIVQFPILIGVYRALYDPTFAGHDFLGIQLLFPVSLTSAHTMVKGPAIQDTIDVTVATLGLHGQIWHVPAGLPLIGGSFWYLPALGLVVLYAGSSYLMQRVMRAAQKPTPEFEAEFKAEMNSKPDPNAPPDFAAQMQRQMGLMNVFLLFIAFLFSAGALLYFIVQNLLMSLEYTFLSKRAGGPQFDAKALKAFIRRPPPPLPQKGVPPAGKQAKGAGKPGSALPGRNGSEDDGGMDTDRSETQAGAADQPAEAGLTQRPRKKKRRR